MDREQWNVDAELSRLKEEIRENQSEPPIPEHGPPRDDGPHQQIRGHRNVQVGGNLTVHAHKVVNPNHPDAIRCPQCQELTYRRSDWCAECHFNLRRHRIDLAKIKKEHRLMRIALFFGIPGLLALFAGTKFFAGHDARYFLGAGVALLAVAALAVLGIAQR